VVGNDWLALGVTLTLSLIWLRLNDTLAQRRIISAPLSRKIIHIGTGPLFVVCWLLFGDANEARYLAALVPLGITAQFALVGMGVMKDQATVDALARHGDRREILRGPLFYGIVFVILTILYWRDNAIGVVALMMLCGGDGLADIIGKRGGRYRLPWSPRKSWAGSAAMLFGAWIFAVGVVWIYRAAGYFLGPATTILLGISIMSVAATFIESLPFQDIDNLTVPLTAVVLGHFLLLK